MDQRPECWTRFGFKKGSQNTSSLSSFPLFNPTTMAELDYLATIPGIPFPQIYETMMDWKTPIIAAIAYEAGVQVLSRIFGSSATSLSRVEAKKRGDQTARKSNPLMTAFCLAHNMALCIYSAITFYNMVKGLHKARTRDAPLFDRVSYRKGNGLQQKAQGVGSDEGGSRKVILMMEGDLHMRVCCIYLNPLTYHLPHRF